MFRAAPAMAAGSGADEGTHWSELSKSMHDPAQMDQSFHAASTRGLFVRIIALSVSAPMFSAAVFFGYMYWVGEPVGRSEIKELALYTWAATLAALLLFSLRHRRFGAPAPEPTERSSRVIYLSAAGTTAAGSPVSEPSPGSRVAAWESRHTRRIVRTIAIATALFVAAGAAVLAGVGSPALEQLGGRGRAELIGGIWIAGLVIIAYGAVRIRRIPIVLTARRSGDSTTSTRSDL